MEFEIFMRQVLKNLNLSDTQVDGIIQTADDDFEFKEKRKFGSADSPTGPGHISIQVGSSSFSCPGTSAAQTKAQGSVYLDRFGRDLK